MELLVVVTIIGILATITAPSLLMFRDIMTQSASQQIIGTISTAIEQYHGDFERNFANSYEAYPPSDDGAAGRYLLTRYLLGYPNDDGAQGLGFRVKDADGEFDSRAPVRGPYGGTEELELTRGNDKAFIDAFGNEIYYYRWNTPEQETNNGYSSDDNGGGPGNINAYVQADNNASNDNYDYYRRDYLLMSKGLEEEWGESPSSGIVSNFGN